MMYTITRGRDGCAPRYVERMFGPPSDCNWKGIMWGGSLYTHAQACTIVNNMIDRTNVRINEIKEF